MILDIDCHQNGKYQCNFQDNLIIRNTLKYLVAEVNFALEGLQFFRYDFCFQSRVTVFLILVLFTAKASEVRIVRHSNTGGGN